MSRELLLQRTYEARFPETAPLDPTTVLHEALRDTSDIFDLARVAVTLRNAGGEMLFSNWSADRLLGSALPEAPVLRRTRGRSPTRLAGILRVISRRLYDRLGDPVAGASREPDGAYRIQMAIHGRAGSSSPALLEIVVNSDSDVRALPVIDRL